MKREEITNRAIDAAAAIDKGDSAVTVIKLLPHFESIVRATLQEAARAVCVWCRDGHPTNAPDAPGFCRTHTVPHSMNGHVATVFCRASEIHDLIAALEEGS